MDQCIIDAAPRMLEYLTGIMEAQLAKLPSVEAVADKVDAILRQQCTVTEYRKLAKGKIRPHEVLDECQLGLDAVASFGVDPDLALLIDDARGTSDDPDSPWNRVGQLAADAVALWEDRIAN